MGRVPGTSGDRIGRAGHRTGHQFDADASAEAGVSALYRAEAKALLGMLSVFLGDVAEAEDVVQESFVRVQRSWHRIEDPVRAPAYLRSTAFNLARSVARRRKRFDGKLLQLMSEARRSAWERSGQDPAWSALGLSEEQRAVLDALQVLSARQRACVVLRYYGGDSVEAIGATLGISANSVKTHLQRAAERLRVELEPLR